MALCSPGISQPKPTTPVVAFLTGVALEGALTLITRNPSWATLLTYVASQTFTTATLCASDPPAVPTITAADVAALLGLPAGYSSGGDPSKFDTLAKIAAWYVFCECSTIATPSPPSLPAYPTGAPVVNPTGVPGVTGSPCWDQSYSFTVFGPAPTYTDYSIGQYLLPDTPVTVTAPYTGGSTNAYTIPTGATNITITISHSTGSTPGPNSRLYWFNSSGTTVTSTSLFDYTSTSTDPAPRVVAVIPSGAVSWNIEVGSYYAGPSTYQTTSWSLSFEVSFFCPGSPTGSVATPCCPPDPILQAKLDQILALLTALGVPALTSYAESTVHAGLTGSGNFALTASTIAVKVAITATAPGTVGIETGDPDRYFEAGVITFSTAEGNFQSVPIQHTPQVIAGPLLSDTLHYTLRGTTVTITELTAGP